MAYFHLKLIAPRPRFPFDANKAEGVAIAAHAAFWQAREEEGDAVAVAPVPSLILRNPRN